MSLTKAVTTIWKLVTWTIFFLVLGIAGLLAAGHYGYINFVRPYVVLSGSMEPTVHTGSIVLVMSKPYGYAPGDIITFKHGNDKTATTHRIHSLEMQNGSIVYQTKGDANKTTDPGVISPDEVVGSMVLTIPYLGRIANYASKPQGFVAFVIVPATIIVYEELKNIKRELTASLHQLLRREKVAAPPPPHPQPSKFTFSFSRPQKPDSGFLKAGFLLLPLVAGLLIGYPATRAMYHDTATSINNFFQASSTFATAEPETTPTPSPTTQPSPTPEATPSGDIVLPPECSSLQGIITTVIQGTSGNDHLYGTSASELIIGGGGNDYIGGDSGSDCIVGGTGNDQILAGAGDDIIISSGGNDQISGHAGNDTIYAGSDNDQLRGDDGDDTIYAGAGNDTLTAGAGLDHLYGESGNDHLTGDAGDDYLEGGDDTDVLNGSSGTDTCISGETLISCEL